MRLWVKNNLVIARRGYPTKFITGRFRPKFKPSPFHILKIFVKMRNATPSIYVQEEMLLSYSSKICQTE